MNATIPTYPAFPVTIEGNQGPMEYAGLTKREYFAAQAMQGILNGAMGSFGPDAIKFETLAKAALRCADALISELNK